MVTRTTVYLPMDDRAIVLCILTYKNSYVLSVVVSSFATLSGAVVELLFISKINVEITFSLATNVVASNISGKGFFPKSTSIGIGLFWTESVPIGIDLFWTESVPIGIVLFWTGAAIGKGLFLTDVAIGKGLFLTDVETGEGFFSVEVATKPLLRWKGSEKKMMAIIAKKSQYLAMMTTFYNFSSWFAPFELFFPLNFVWNCRRFFFLLTPEKKENAHPIKQRGSCSQFQVGQFRTLIMRSCVQKYWLHGVHPLLS